MAPAWMKDDFVFGNIDIEGSMFALRRRYRVEMSSKGIIWLRTKVGISHSSRWERRNA
jgi:hypothetical protein